MCAEGRTRWWRPAGSAFAAFADRGLVRTRKCSSLQAVTVLQDVRSAGVAVVPDVPCKTAVAFVKDLICACIVPISINVQLATILPFPHL